MSRSIFKQNCEALAHLQTLAHVVINARYLSKAYWDIYSDTYVIPFDADYGMFGQVLFEFFNEKPVVRMDWRYYVSPTGFHFYLNPESLK